MAFPASQSRLENVLDTIQKRASQIKNEVQSLRDTSATNNVARSRFANLMRSLQQTIDEWDALSSTPGLAAYAQEQFNDPTLDLAAEYTAMRAAAVTLRDWIFNAIPTHSPSGAALMSILNADGTVTPIEVTPAQSSGFRTEADIFIATIG